MGIPAINQLANMEYLLYGGKSGMNAACPSYINGYKGNSFNSLYNQSYSNFLNPAFRGYQNKDIFTLQNDATNINSNLSNQARLAGEETNTNIDYNNPNFRGLSDDLNELGDYYVKNAAPSESIVGAAVGGATFGLLNNPRLIAHPINSITSIPAVERAFADVKKAGTALNALYTDGKGGYEIVSEAYARMHKLESLHNKKLGIFRRSLKSTPELESAYAKLKPAFEAAIKSGDAQAIAKYTEEAKRLTNAFTGALPRGLRAIGLQKPFTQLRKFINPSQYEEIGSVVSKNLAEAGNKTTLAKALGRSCGVGNGLFFAGFEFLNDIAFEHKIQDAFAKDKQTGWKQVKQTAIKGIGSAAGWAIGEGIGTWAGAKIGAALGTAVCPGVGTAIGAVAGLIGGSVGCWLAGKVTHKIIGQEAGTLAKVEKMKQTKEGQVELLTLTAQQAQDDKKISPKTVKAIQNVASFYGAA